MHAKIKRKWKKWQVGPNRLTAGSPVGNRLLTIQITNYVMFRSPGRVSDTITLPKGESITLSKRKGRLINNLEKRKLAARDESLTGRRRSPKMNDNDSGDELLTSRNPYAFYNESETGLELYDPAHLFNTNKENKKDSNSPDNPIILNND
ncbi:hypothetical protein F5882DRAFT_383311 [Hyaloscypha sp. PMI_1271]|nr:hypothetical protein F5882DRAFT_383311 [Hyaloscypha sp. PMI_1271]